MRRRRALALLAAAAAAPAPVSSAGLDPATRERLSDDRDRMVWIVLQTGAAGPQAAGDLLRFGSPARRAYDFPSIMTTAAEVRAGDLLDHHHKPVLAGVEVVAPPLVNAVLLVLLRLNQVLFYARMGAITYGAINLSLGPPAAFADRPGAATASVRAAIEAVVRAGIPVVVAAGNDGPAPGLVNPWALAEGVIIAGATDAAGTRVFGRSARFTPDQLAGRILVGAHGMDVAGQPAGWMPASQCAWLPGATPGAPVPVAPVSGTSQAAGAISRMLALPHQAMALLRAKISPQAPLAVTNPPFLLGYLDWPDPARHPVGQLPEEAAQAVFRQGLRRRHLSGLQLEVELAAKERFVRKLMGSNFDLDMRYGPRLVSNLLLAAARPVEGADAAALGAGYVSPSWLMGVISNLRMSHLPRLLLPPGHERRLEWARRLAASDEKLFSQDEAERIWTYGSCYTLQDVLAVEGEGNGDGAHALR